MAQFLRPDADVANTWTNGWAAIDEATASDADFVSSGNNPNGSGAEFSLSNPSTPNSGTCTVRFREVQLNGTTPDAGGTLVTLDVQILQGASLIASSGAHNLGVATWRAGSFTFATSLVSNWADLRVKFVASGGSGGPSARRGAGVSWAEIEIPDAAPAAQAGSGGGITDADTLSGGAAAPGAAEVTGGGFADPDTASGGTAAGAGGGGGSAFSDSFDYTAGTDLDANGYTTTVQSALGEMVLVAGSGAVQMDGNNGTHRVTRTSPPDPGSDDVYCELDAQFNTVPTLNATRFTIRNDSGDLEARVGPSAIVILKGGSSVATGSWSPTAGVEYVIRFEVDVPNDTLRLYAGGVLRATKTAAGLISPHDRTFEFGIQIGTDAAEIPYPQINAVRIGSISGASSGLSASGGAVADPDAIRGGSIAPGPVAVGGLHLTDPDAINGGDLAMNVANLLAHSDPDTFGGGSITMNVSGVLLADGDSIGGGSASPGPVTVSGILVIDADQIRGGSASQGAPPAQDVTGGGVTDGDAFGGGASLPGAVTVTGVLFTDPDAIGGGQVAAAPSGAAGLHVVDPDAFRGGGALPGAVQVSGVLVLDPDAFRGGAAATGAATVAGGGFGDADTLTGGVGAPGARQAAGGGFSDADWIDGGFGALEGVKSGGDVTDPDAIRGGTASPGPVAVSGGGVLDLDAMSGGAVAAFYSAGAVWIMDPDSYGFGSATPGPVFVGNAFVEDLDFIRGGIARLEGFVWTPSRPTLPDRLPLAAGRNLSGRVTLPARTPLLARRLH